MKTSAQPRTRSKTSVIFSALEYLALTALAVVALQVYRLDLMSALGLVCTALLAKEMLVSITLRVNAAWPGARPGAQHGKI